MGASDGAAPPLERGAAGRPRVCSALPTIGCPERVLAAMGHLERRLHSPRGKPRSRSSSHGAAMAVYPTLVGCNLPRSPPLPKAGAVTSQDQGRKTMTKKNEHATVIERARPVPVQHAEELQHYGTVARLPIALDADVCAASAQNLNQLLADTMTLRDLYKKHHWQVSGVTFYQLHLLFDKHFSEQSEMVDSLAERIQSLGGVSIAMAHDVAETTLIPRPPRGREEVPVQLSRLLHAHEIVLKEARAMARQATEAGDDGTNDLLVSDVIRTNEMHVWFVGEHLVPVGPE